MGVNLSTATCFLPFNRNITEDLAGNTEWEIVGNTNTSYINVQDRFYRTPSKTLYINNQSTTTYIKSKSSSIWNFDDNDFTISFWFMPLKNMTSGNVISYFASDTDFKIGIFSNGSRMCYFGSNNGSSWTFGDAGISGIGSIDIMQSQWHHCAYVRSGNMFYGWINGQKDWELNVGSNFSIAHREEQLKIGLWGNPVHGSYMYMSEFMVDIGHALYTQSFTPRSYLRQGISNNISLSE